MRWDLFCRVIDNFGDVGVCWRLAADLAARGVAVRLWIDDASALEWMAPQGTPAVEVGAFDAAGEPGDVVVEAFGCDPPAGFVARMTPRTVWINLEYLSAEDWVERSHGLPSPRADGLRKWFFYPGFTGRTGGLLREPGLIEERKRFEDGGWRDWLSSRGLLPQQGERVVTLFCYDNPAVPALVQALADQPTLLLLTPGAARRQVAEIRRRPRGVRAVALPWLTQAEFDRLLWSSDLNFVRGEDSLVRAVWAGQPFVWQAYPQKDGVHERKLHALLERMPLVPGLAELWRAWNGLDGPEDLGAALPPWPDAGAWKAACDKFRSALAAQSDLGTQLLAFAGAKAAAC